MTPHWINAPPDERDPVPPTIPDADDINALYSVLDLDVQECRLLEPCGHIFRCRDLDAADDPSAPAIGPRVVNPKE